MAALGMIVEMNISQIRKLAGMNGIQLVPRGEVNMKLGFVC